MPQIEPRLVRFLLGGPDEDEDERRRVEIEFLENESAFEDLLALEDELRFEYLQDRLSPEQRAGFEAKYLVTSEDRARLAFARALLHRARTPAATPPATAAPVRAAWWQRPALGFALAATLVLAASTAWLFTATRRMQREIETLRADLARTSSWPDEARRLQDELTRERARRERLEQQIAQTTSSGPPAPVFALALAPGLSRSPGTEAPRAGLEAVREGLRLDLRLPADARAAAYRIALRDADGRDLWVGLNVQRSGTTASVTIPGSVLGRGDYEVVLRGADARGRSEDLASYYFSIGGR